MAFLRPAELDAPTRGKADPFHRRASVLCNNFFQPAIPGENDPRREILTVLTVKR